MIFVLLSNLLLGKFGVRAFRARRHFVACIQTNLGVAVGAGIRAAARFLTGFVNSFAHNVFLLVRY